mgnify:CR=1 FL=1
MPRYWLKIGYSGRSRERTPHYMHVAEALFRMGQNNLAQTRKIFDSTLEIVQGEIKTGAPLAHAHHAGELLPAAPRLDQRGAGGSPAHQWRHSNTSPAGWGDAR